MSNNNIVGSKIKGIRESKNLTIEEISERSGLSVEQINSIENDQNLPCPCTGCATGNIHG